MRRFGSARFLPLLGGLALVAACGNAAPTWHADVAHVLDAHCAPCHGDSPAGGLDLRDPTAAAAARELIAARVADRTMPPWAVTDSHPLRDDPSLSDEQIAAIEGWAGAEAPLGNPSEAPPPLRLKFGEPVSSDTHLRMAQSFSPPEGDSYRCFPLDWPWDEERFITAHTGEPGDEEGVHHLVLFFVHPDEHEVITEFDAADDGPGYPCYGGLTPDGWAGPTPRFRFGAAWAPGGQGQALPDGTGLRIPSGTVPVLQVHYHRTGEPFLDQSGFSFRTEPSVETEGYYLPWFDLRWYFDDLAMEIPAGTETVEHGYEAVPGTSTLFLDVSEGGRLEHGVRLWSVLPHMHRLGRSLRLERVGDTGRDLLLEAGRYDFRWQHEYRFVEPITLSPTDQLGVRCSFENTESWRRTRGVVPEQPQTTWFGESTADEMCLAIVYVTDAQSTAP